MTPSGWKKGRLGENCSIEIGGTPSRDVAEYWDDAKETSNLWVSIKDLNQRIITETAEHISDLGIRHSNVKLQGPGTVLLSFKLTIGRVAVAGCPLYTNEAIAGLRSSKIAQEFLYHGLQHWNLLKGVDQAIKGATLNKEKLKRIECSFPDQHSEQVKIAEILSTVDLAIEETERLVAKHQHIKAGLMQDLFTRGLDEHCNLRSENTHKFRESPLGRIPEEWRFSKLECVGTWASGTTPSKANPSYWGDEIPWVCPKDMKTFDIASTMERLTKLGAQRGSKLMPKKTVFIVVRGMILAHTFPVCISDRPMAFNQDVKGIIANPGFNERFLAFWLASQAANFLKLATTATHGTKRFDIKELFDVIMPVPRHDEQTGIVVRLDAAEAPINYNRKVAAKLRSIKAGLMQDLLIGRRRVTRLLESEPKRERIYA